MSAVEEEELAQKNRTFVTNATKNLDAEEKRVAFAEVEEQKRILKDIIASNKKLEQDFVEQKRFNDQRAYDQYMTSKWDDTLKSQEMELKRLHEIKAEYDKILVDINKRMQELSAEIHQYKVIIKELTNKINIMTQKFVNNLQNAYDTLPMINTAPVKIQLDIKSDILDKTKESIASIIELGANKLGEIQKMVGSLVISDIDTKKHKPCEIRDRILHHTHEQIKSALRGHLAPHVSSERLDDIILRESRSAHFTAAVAKQADETLSHLKNHAPDLEKDALEITLMDQEIEKYKALLLEVERKQNKLSITKKEASKESTDIKNAITNRQSIESLRGKLDALTIKGAEPSSGKINEQTFSDPTISEKGVGLFQQERENKTPQTEHKSQTESKISMENEIEGQISSSIQVEGQAKTKQSAGEQKSVTDQEADDVFAADEDELEPGKPKEKPVETENEFEPGQPKKEMHEQSSPLQRLLDKTAAKDEHSKKSDEIASVSDEEADDLFAEEEKPPKMRPH